MKLIKKAKKGFTLIELVVVIAVIAILSAVSVVAYVGITNSAKKSAAGAEAGQIVNVVRGCVMSNSDGYTEQKSEGDEAAVSGKSYHVSLSGRLLSFEFVGDDTEVTAEQKVLIINDLLKEVGEETVEADSIKEANSTTSIGVLVDGNSGKYEYASF